MIHVSTPDDSLHDFARHQASSFFGNNVSAYIVSLIEGDREQGWTHQRILKAIQSGVDDEARERVNELMAVS